MRERCTEIRNEPIEFASGTQSEYHNAFWYNTASLPRYYESFFFNLGKYFNTKYVCVANSVSTGLPRIVNHAKFHSNQMTALLFSLFVHSCMVFFLRSSIDCDCYRILCFFFSLVHVHLPCVCVFVPTPANKCVCICMHFSILNCFFFPHSLG